LQQTVVIGNLHNAKYIEENSQNTHSNQIALYTVSMAIKNFVWVELDRAIHKELNNTKFILLLMSAFFEIVK